MSWENMIDAGGLGTMCIRSIVASAKTGWIITFLGEFVTRVRVRFGERCLISSLKLPGLSWTSLNQCLLINAQRATLIGRDGTVPIVDIRLQNPRCRHLKTGGMIPRPLIVCAVLLINAQSATLIG